MHIAFLNPQGNFDPQDSHLAAHPDFGGQLVYVKQVALAMAAQGHRVDILTRRIVDPAWPEFAAPLDAYPGIEGVRIVRLAAGPPHFLRKELLWPHLVRDWVPNILGFYEAEGRLPDVMTAHYGDGGLAGVLIEARTGIPFTFTAHSLGAQKMDKLSLTPENIAAMDAHYHFATRLMAERLSMNRSGVNIVSTAQERWEQYAHRAYRGAVDVREDRRFAVIPPGVDLTLFDCEARSSDEAAAHRHVEAMLARDLAPARRSLPCIVVSARLDPKKNHAGLVRAFALSPELRRRANIVLLTGGLDDPLRDDADASPTEREVLTQLRYLVAAHHLEGEVAAFAVRGQAALAATYRYLAQRGSVFALTAFYEPFGLAPLEAAAAGLPVVVTRNGGPRESLQDADGTTYGILVNPTDVTEIAEGLLRLLRDREVWQHFAHRGRQRVHARYTWTRTAEGYLRLLADLVAAPSARRAAHRLPIPPYFRDPRPEYAIPLRTLCRLYFGGAAEACAKL